MVTTTADPIGSGRRLPSRRSRQRRPPASRLDLSPEEFEAKEAERRRKLRSKLLGVKLTADEKAELLSRAKASGNRLSDFARIVLLSDLKAPAPAARDPQALHALSFQLSKLGTNLNQLAKVANERRDLPREAEFRRLADQIAAAIEGLIAL